MKIRMGFVSNSSSSSFVLALKQHDYTLEEFTMELCGYDVDADIGGIKWGVIAAVLFGMIEGNYHSNVSYSDIDLLQDVMYSPEVDATITDDQAWTDDTAWNAQTFARMEAAIREVRRFPQNRNLFLVKTDCQSWFQTFLRDNQVAVFRNVWCRWLSDSS